MLSMGACVDTTPVAERAFTDFDPLNASFAELETLVEVPVDAVLRPGDVELSLSGIGQGRAPVGIVVQMEAHSEEASVRGVGYRAVWFGLSEESVEDLAAVQAEMRGRKAARAKGSVSLNISVSGCQREDGEIVPLWVSLRLKEGDDLVPVYEAGQLEVAGTGEMRACTR